MHYADANEPEIAIATHFLNAITFIFGPHSDWDLDLATKAFVDFIVEARKLQRLPDRGVIYQSPDLWFTVRHLLTHIPLQRWPLPHRNHRPCSFCDETINPYEMEQHMERWHPEVYRRGYFHSEIQAHLAGSLGIGIEVVKQSAWRCPFPTCKAEFQRYSDISMHIDGYHDHAQKKLYNDLGGFWAGIFWHLRLTGEWPTVQVIFYQREAPTHINVIPIEREVSDRVWQPDRRMLTEEALEGIRVLPGTPLEDLLRLLRRRASAPSSVETSECERFESRVRRSEDDGNEDKDVRERMEVQPVVQQGPLRPRPCPERGEAEEGAPAAVVAAGVRAAVVEEGEAIQEAEDDTEHEAQIEEERTETEADIFGEREDVTETERPDHFNGGGKGELFQASPGTVPLTLVRLAAVDPAELRRGDHFSSDRTPALDVPACSPLRKQGLTLSNTVAYLNIFDLT
jgi:hypothetical protein